MKHFNQAYICRHIVLCALLAATSAAVQLADECTSREHLYAQRGKRSTNTLSNKDTCKTTTTTTPKSRPNILLLLVEDMGIQIPAYGDNTQPTPHLSQLASEGVVFETAHVTAASCSPSRGSMHSGLYPIQNGIWAFVGKHGYKYRSGLTTFVELLHNNGYATGLTYKTGVRGDPEVDRASTFVQAWDFFPDFKNKTLTTVDPFTNEPADPLFKGCEEVRNARLFEHFLNRTVAPGTPFYFLGQVFDTHIAGWLSKDKATWYPSPICNTHFGVTQVDPAAVDSANFQGLGPYTVSTANKQALVGYYAAVQRVDHYVGDMLKLLKASGREQNTLTIFSSDHGISHVCKGKTTAYEGGLRVPLIMRWPGRVAAVGARTDALVSMVDFAPTILEAAGIAAPSYYPGHSVVPVLEGTATATRQYLFSAYTAHTTGLSNYWPTRSARDARFKIIQNIMAEGVDETNAPMTFNQEYEQGVCPMGSNPFSNSGVHPRQVFELYDLVADPHETTSLIGNAEHATTETRLKAALDHWRRTVLDDPFLDAGFRSRFHAQELVNLEWYKAKSASEKLEPTGLWWEVDRSEYLPAWDDAQYSNKDPLVYV